MLTLQDIDKRVTALLVIQVTDHSMSWVYDEGIIGQRIATRFSHASVPCEGQDMTMDIETFASRILEPITMSIMDTIHRTTREHQNGIIYVSTKLSELENARSCILRNYNGIAHRLALAHNVTDDQQHLGLTILWGYIPTSEERVVIEPEPVVEEILPRRIRLLPREGKND
jgi:hypothetical protein